MKTFKIIFKDGRVAYKMAESVEKLQEFYLKLGKSYSSKPDDYYLNLISKIEEY